MRFVAKPSSGPSSKPTVSRMLDHVLGVKKPGAQKLTVQMFVAFCGLSQKAFQESVQKCGSYFSFSQT